jgi:hypothetical protein
VYDVFAGAIIQLQEKQSLRSIAVVKLAKNQLCENFGVV